MPDVYPGRFGGTVEVAGLRQLQRAPHGVDRARILEREIVGVVGHHQEAGRRTAASVKEPKEKHPGGIRDGTLLGKRSVLALGMAVDVGDGRDTWVAQRFYFALEGETASRPIRPAGTFAMVGAAFAFPFGQGRQPRYPSISRIRAFMSSP